MCQTILEPCPSQGHTSIVSSNWGLVRSQARHLNHEQWLQYLFLRLHWRRWIPIRQQQPGLQSLQVQNVSSKHRIWENVSAKMKQKQQLNRNTPPKPFGCAQTSAWGQVCWTTLILEGATSNCLEDCEGWQEHLRESPVVTIQSRPRVSADGNQTIVQVCTSTALDRSSLQIDSTWIWYK